MKKDLKFTPSLPRGLATAGHSVKYGSKFIPSAMGMLGRSKSDLFAPTWMRGGWNNSRGERFGGFTLDWWTDTAMFSYDALMVSAYYGMENPDFREYYKIPRKDFLFIADSGGFQISRHDIALEPADIIKWMEKNVDVGLTLDDPPTPEERTNLTLDLLKPHGMKSRRNYEVMHRSWKSDDLELLKVIQGDNVEQLEWWWDLMADLEFDGASIACRPPTPGQTAMGLGFMMHNDVKKVHVLLGTGDATIPVIIYARKWFDRLTVDSASFSLAGARYRTYYLPFARTQALEFGRQFTSTVKHLPCDCPVCRMATIDDMNIERGGHETKTASLSGGLIALHNLYTVLRHYWFLEVLSDDRDAYFKYLKSAGLTETIESIEFLEKVADVGYYDALGETQKDVEGWLA